MKKIGFIRHGTTEWNMAGRMQGQKDTPLAEIGKLQTNYLGERLQKETWDGIIASDLIRAQVTAELLASLTNIPLLGVDARIRERSFGELEGTTLQERILKWGEHWRELDLGMETHDQVLMRWQSFSKEMENKYAGKRILVVSHGGFIEPVLGNTYGRFIKGHLLNTSLTVIEREGMKWCCKLLNCTKHLGPLDA
jgi:2,3-bisphosphoglycerate-dependent phosphoglycerate mutase